MYSRHRNLRYGNHLPRMDIYCCRRQANRSRSDCIPQRSICTSLREPFGFSMQTRRNRGSSNSRGLLSIESSGGRHSFSSSLVPPVPVVRDLSQHMKEAKPPRLLFDEVLSIWDSRSLSWWANAVDDGSSWIVAFNVPMAPGTSSI